LPQHHSNEMKIIIPGGAGQMGQVLARDFVQNGHEVVILSRNPSTDNSVRTVSWDGRSIGGWAAELDGADVVINLAGRIVNCRYNEANRREIMQSRLNSTRAIGAAVRAAKRPPRVWLQASTATIYSHRYDAPNDEATGMVGGSEPDAPAKWRFSIEVAQAWEQAMNDFRDLSRTRRVLLRSAVTMSPDRGGIFDTLLGLVRVGLGGASGDGRQYVSWIHDVDFVRAINWLIAHESIEGPINLAAPNPLPNAEFMRALREAWGIGVGLPATKWMLEIGAVFLGTETELVLKSRRVVPARLLHEGFSFKHPAWPEAAHDLCARWRQQNDSGKA
jgi:uncharacterized protein (TIGR01777 family)